MKIVTVKLAATALVVGMWGQSLCLSAAWAVDDGGDMPTLRSTPSTPSTLSTFPTTTVSDDAAVPIVVSDAEDTAIVIIPESEEEDRGPGQSGRSDGSERPNQIDAPEDPSETEPQPKKPMSRRGRIKELEDIKAQLAVKELELLSKENALLEKEQSISVLRQELEIERKLRDLIIKEKEDAEEEALLSKSLCTGSTMLP